MFGPASFKVQLLHAFMQAFYLCITAIVEVENLT